MKLTWTSIALLLFGLSVVNGMGGRGGGGRVGGRSGGQRDGRRGYEGGRRGYGGSYDGGGEVCDPPCISTAVCRRGSCHCKPEFSKGRPDLFCFNPVERDYKGYHNRIHCLLFGDPHLKTFETDRASVIFPCKVPFSQLISGAESCLTQFFVTGVMVDEGFVYINIVHVFVVQGLSGLTIKLQRDGPSSFTIDAGTEHTLPNDGTITQLSVGDARVFVVFNEDDDAWVIYSSKISCDFTLLFRPHYGDGDRSEQIRTPYVGLITSEKRHYFTPESVYPNTLCSAPNSSHALDTSLQELNIAPELVVLYNFLNLGQTQDLSVTGGQECQDASDIFMECPEDRREQAIQCGFILHSERARCLIDQLGTPDASSDVFNVLFLTCLEDVCNGVNPCTRLDTALNNQRNCLPDSVREMC